MVSVDKFFVYGGGRWREVDSSSGRIDGWGRAKFLVARGGKLESTKSRTVLAALRALAENKPSAAKEGPQLPYRFPRPKSRDRVHQGCKHQCCHHTNSGSSCISKISDKASIAIQCNKTDISHNKTELLPKIMTLQNSTNINVSTNAEITQNREKRKRVSSSSEELFQTKIAVATIHSPRKPEAKRRRISNNRLNRNSTSSQSIKPAKKSPLLPGKRKRSSSEETVILESKSERHRKKNGRLRKKRKNSDKIQPRRSARHNVSIVISDKSDNEETRTNKKRESRFKGPDSSSDLKSKDSSVDDSERKDLQTRKILESSTPSRIRKISESSTDEPKYRKTITERLGRKVKKGKSNTSDEPIMNRLGPKQTLVLNKVNKVDELRPRKSLKKAEVNMHEKLKPKNRLSDKPIYSNGLKTLKSSDKIKHNVNPVNVDKANSDTDLSITIDKANKNSQIMSKELIIDENDVEILRIFLQNHYPDEDLLRFDMDDEYKKMHFYRINPLVYVERCPRIARMIQDSQDDRLSLLDFASKLGLRSISEASSVKRYRTRRRDEKKKYTEDVEDKENEKPSERSNSLHKVKRKERNHKSNREDSKDIDELSSDSGQRIKLVRRRETEQKSVKEKGKDYDGLGSSTGKKIKVVGKIKPKAVSKRPPINEYTNLEDHAIVSWVSVGGRACSVNGNRIWIMLQEQFQRITGRERTWHSLRNRYLRYILPRLGALALPPSLQTRLRAAAATGELKAKRRGVKRNSMFKTPARGAFSRRPPRLDSEQETERENEEDAAPPPAPRPRTPRYSDVTRQFAQKHRYSSERSSSHELRRSRRQSPDKSRRKSSESSIDQAKNSVQSRSPIKNRNQSGTSDKSRTRNEKSSRRSNTESETEESDSDFENIRKSRTPQNNTPKGVSRKSVAQRKSYRAVSVSSYDSSDSNSSDPPDPPRRKSERRKSLSASPRRRSHRITSPDTKRNKSPDSKGIKSLDVNINQDKSLESRRKSNRKTLDKSHRDSSNLSANSPILNRRKSSRFNSPERRKKTLDKSHRDSSDPSANSPILNKRKSSRFNSPERRKKTLDKSHRDSSDPSANSPILNKRKSSRFNSPERRKSNRVKSPSKSDSRNPKLHESKVRANSPGRRKSNRNRETKLEVSGEKINESHESKIKKTRKLFNPRDVL